MNSTCVISSLRLNFSVHESRSNDKTYWLAVVGLCGAVEVAMVILCGCFPTFPRFFKWVKEDGRGTMGHRSKSYTAESQSRLRSDVASVELGKIGVTREVRVTI